MALTTTIVADMSDPAAEPACVLIVDDERHNRELLEIMLKPEGFLLLSAASGEEALALIARQPPDLILLDVMMPGMSGYDVAGKIKSDPATKNIPVIMLTALEFLVAFLQAYVFAILTCIYLNDAIHPGH